MGQILLFNPEATAPEVIHRKTRVTLEEVQKMVGGYVEMPARWTDPLKGEVQVMLNEDGHSRGLRNNPAATVWLTEACLAAGQPLPNMAGMIVGPMVVLIGKDVVWD